jgi:regulator of sigma E protease
MMSALYSILAFVLALGILVAVHEFGHFWVAQRLGVKILRFSIGFGRIAWRRQFGPDQTEFAIATIPLGGYVKMLDEREGEVPEAELHRAFNRQPLAYRTAIVFAGPLFNFLFAIVVYWLMFVIGVAGLKPIVGEVIPVSAAERAGFRPGDQIVAVDSQPTPTWNAVLQACIERILDTGEVVMNVRGGGELERELRLALRSSVSLDDVSRGNLSQKLGIKPYRPRLPAVIGEVMAGGAAARAGLRPGDRIGAADGQPIEYWDNWVEYVQARPERLIQVEIRRANERVVLDLTPDRIEQEGSAIGRIGASVAAPEGLEQELLAVEQYNPLTAFTLAVRKTGDLSWFTLQILGQMLAGQASLQNLSGPISIARYAGESASIGLVAFLAFLGLISVSLGVVNLLPVPLLDGGHLLYYLIEFISRKPVSETAQIVGQQIGLVILLGLMGLALYNDIMRLLFN